MTCLDPLITLIFLSLSSLMELSLASAAAQGLSAEIDGSLNLYWKLLIIGGFFPAIAQLAYIMDEALKLQIAHQALELLGSATILAGLLTLLKKRCGS